MLFILILIYISNAYETICEYYDKCEYVNIPIVETINNINNALAKQNIDVNIPLPKTNLDKDYDFNILTYVNNYLIENDYNYTIEDKSKCIRGHNLNNGHLIELFYNGNINNIHLYYKASSSKYKEITSIKARFDPYSSYNQYNVSEFLTHILKSLKLYHNYKYDILDLINLYLEKDGTTNYYKFINIPIMLQIYSITVDSVSMDFEADNFINFNECFGFTYKIDGENITFHNLLSLTNENIVDIMKNFTKEKDKIRVIFYYTKGLDYYKLITIFQFINKNYDYRVKTCQIEENTKYININNCSKVINYKNGEDKKCEDVIEIYEIETNKKYNPANVDIRIIGDTYINNYLRQMLYQVKAFAIHETSPFDIEYYIPRIETIYMYDTYNLDYENYTIIKISAEYSDKKYKPDIVLTNKYEYCADIYDDASNINMYYYCIGTYYYCNDKTYTIIKGSLNKNCINEITYEFKTCDNENSNNDINSNSNDSNDDDSSGNSNDISDNSNTNSDSNDNSNNDDSSNDNNINSNTDSNSISENSIDNSDTDNNDINSNTNSNSDNNNNNDDNSNDNSNDINSNSNSNSNTDSNNNNDDINSSDINSNTNNSNTDKNNDIDNESSSTIFTNIILFTIIIIIV